MRTKNSLAATHTDSNTLGSKILPEHIPKPRFEPMLMLVVGIPLLTVIGGIFTIYLAFNGPHESAIAKPEPNFKGVPLR